MAATAATTTTTTTRILVSDPRNDNVGPNSKKVSTTYSVSTPNSSVRRRYSDFQWLQIRLSQEYPGAIVPIIPHQRSGMLNQNRLDPDFIERRRHALQRFIQSILDHPEFYNATTYWQSSVLETSNDVSALRIFLTIPLGDDFEFAKKLSESSYDATSNIAIAGKDSATKCESHLFVGLCCFCVAASSASVVCIGSCFCRVRFPCILHALVYSTLHVVSSPDDNSRR